MGRYRVVVDAQTHAVQREEMTFEEALESLKHKLKRRVGRNPVSGQSLVVPAMTKEEFVAEVHRLMEEYGVDPAVCADLLKQ